MIYTPLSHLTTDELVQQVLNTENPSWMELELVQRIEQLQEQLGDLTDEPEAVCKSPADFEGVPV